MAIKALDPELKVFAPVREWAWSREEEIDYAIKHNIPVPIQHDSPYSIDQNLWGRSNECGILEDPYAAPPKDAYDLTQELEDAPDEADEIVLTFEQGIPTALDGKIL